MENKKAKLRKVISEIIFEPTFQFHKVRFDLCEKFIKKLPHWNFDMSNVSLYNHINWPESRKRYVLQNHRAVVEFKEVVYFPDYENFALEFIKDTIEILGVKELLRCGQRFFYLYKIKGDWAKYVLNVIDKSFNKKCLNALRVDEIDDFSYRIHSKKNDFYCSLNLMHTRKTQEDLIYAGDLGKYMLIDLDYFNKGLAPSKFESFLKKSYELSQEFLINMIKYWET